MNLLCVHFVWEKAESRCNFCISPTLKSSEREDPFRIFNMAGIIARITRSNRERLAKKHTEIGINKCNYDILPFGERFIKRVSITASSISRFESKQLKKCCMMGIF